MGLKNNENYGEKNDWLWNMKQNWESDGVIKLTKIKIIYEIILKVLTM